LALIVIGAIGYIEKLKPLSDALLVLIIIALFLTRGSPAFPGGGFFAQLSKALGGTIGTGGSVTIGGGTTKPTTPGTIPTCVPSATESCAPGSPGVPVIVLK